jgi:hypothetical protein
MYPKNKSIKRLKEPEIYKYIYQNQWKSNVRNRYTLFVCLESLPALTIATNFGCGIESYKLTARRAALSATTGTADGSFRFSIFVFKQK